MALEQEELKELRTAAPGLVVLAGIEVSAWEGHFLVYGVHNPFALFRGIRVGGAPREVHIQGGAVVAADPFRWEQPFDEILRTEQPELDGMELFTSHMDTRIPEIGGRSPSAASAGGNRLQ